MIENKLLGYVQTLIENNFGLKWQIRNDWHTNYLVIPCKYHHFKTLEMEMKADKGLYSTLFDDEEYNEETGRTLYTKGILTKAFEAYQEDLAYFIEENKLSYLVRKRDRKTDKFVNDYGYCIGRCGGHYALIKSEDFEERKRNIEYYIDSCFGGNLAFMLSSIPSEYDGQDVISLLTAVSSEFDSLKSEVEDMIQYVTDLNKIYDFTETWRDGISFTDFEPEHEDETDGDFASPEITKSVLGAYDSMTARKEQPVTTLINV